MINKLIFDAPFNSLSFGNVSYNFLRELYKREDLEVIVFPNGDKVDFSAFEPTQDFLQKFQASCSDRLKKYSKDIPTLKLWHLNGSERKLTPKHFLYTFHELDFATEEEINIVNSQTHTFFSSNFSKNVFESLGAESEITSSVPIGFDTDFCETNRYKDSNKIVFGLMGKFEKRKNTAQILKLWAQKYGNNPKYQLIACITNPFIKNEQLESILSQIFNGKKYFNINFIPWLKTNKEVNEVINAVDIDLSGMSGAEGWNLGAFNSTCLGKWSIVLNATAHKDWATKENCILVEPNGCENAVDGVFFQPNGPFNQGNVYSVSDESILNAMSESEQKAKVYNIEGIKLKEKFNYNKTIDRLLNTINNKFR
jgi:hypothetical protein